MRKIITLTTLLVCGCAMADVNLYSETFSGSVGTDYFGGVGNFSYGYDADAGLGAYKALNYGQWGAAVAGDTFTSGVAIPNPGAVTTPKLIGTFLDPALFTGYDGQTLTLHFDIIADTGEVEQNAYVWVYEASGYDTSGANDWLLDVSGVNLGSGDPMGSTGGASVTQTAKSGNLVTATSSSDNTLTFTYNAGTGIGLAFGSYATDVAFDNVSITAIPEPATLGLIAAFGTSVLFIRRLMM